MSVINRISKWFLPSTVALIVVFSPKLSYGQSIAEGKSIFEINCTSCHAIHVKNVGPALANVHTRRDETWLIKWIKNPQAVIASGDAYAVKLYKEYNQAQMTAFGQLTDTEIKSVLAYIKDESAKAPVSTASLVDSTNVKMVANDTGRPVSYNGLLLVLAGLACVVLGLLAYIQSVLQKNVEYKAAKGDITLSKLEDVFANTFNLQISPLQRVGLFLTGFALMAGSGFWYGLEKVGVQQGYAPMQPIAYSHELHAGQYKIACSYCHTGVERGKSATIPSANVCMNCHNVIKPESPEIQKIYAAVDYNVETKTYGKNTKPIQWVRIHNLPDLAYFNHYQHYKIAGIQCQKCHGQIQEMKVVAQHSRLTMGWCIECHTQTKVNLDNGYYKEVHAKYANSKEFKAKGMTISQLGGMECSKCHY